MAELSSEGQNIADIPETVVNTAHRIYVAYREIVEGLEKRELIELIELIATTGEGKESYKTLPLQGDDLPFPLNKRNPSFDLTRENPSQHPNDAELYWEEEDNTYRKVELRVGDVPTYTLETGRIDAEGNRIQNRVVSYSDGNIHVQKSSPMIFSNTSLTALKSSKDPLDRLARRYWKDAKQTLTAVTEGLSS